MAKSATRFSDIQESEWTQSIGTAVVGILILIVAAVLIYCLKYVLPANVLRPSQVVASIGLVLGGAIILGALHRGTQVRKIKTVAFTCPYCEKDTLFPVAPTQDFDCDHCDRTVHFFDGEPVPVRNVICSACRAEHRVAVNVAHYICDSCNRPLRLTPEPKYQSAVVSVHVPEPVDTMLQNYDVLLVGVDRRKENEVAFKLQNILMTNLNEARRLMGTASTRTPLIIGYDLSQRKADAVRRQLQELGATVTLRPTMTNKTPQKTR